MNKKHVLIIAASVFYAATITGQEQIAGFTHVNQMVQKGMIFENEIAQDAMKRRMSDANTWIENSLKENKSDTLQKQYCEQFSVSDVAE